MHKFEIDVPVLLEFFTRHEQFAQVFEQVKKARPSILLLYQDGPRQDRADDILNIEKCRKIAEDIDWECKVHRLYQEKNIGCDPSGYIAQTWAFSIVDRCIILEDDCVPTQSFFPYCSELLEKYKDDTRIAMICGMNPLGTRENCPNSYFFSISSSIWGWATWKRVVDNWDTEYRYIDDKYTLNLLKNTMGKYYNVLLSRCIDHKNSGIEHFESLMGSYASLNSIINIMPTQNMITNIGVAKETTHGTDNIKKYAKAIQKLFFMKRYEIEFPLKHPKYIVEDLEYRKQIKKVMAYEFPLIRFFRGIEVFIRKLIYR